MTRPAIYNEQAALIGISKGELQDLLEAFTGPGDAADVLEHAIGLLGQVETALEQYDPAADKVVHEHTEPLPRQSHACADCGRADRRTYHYRGRRICRACYRVMAQFDKRQATLPHDLT